MSTIGGRGSQQSSSKQRQAVGNSGSSSKLNETRTNTSHRGTPSMKRKRSGLNIGRSTIVTDASYGANKHTTAGGGTANFMVIADDCHTQSQIALNADLLAPTDGYNQ